MWRCFVFWSLFSVKNVIFVNIHDKMYFWVFNEAHLRDKSENTIQSSNNDYKKHQLYFWSNNLHWLTEKMWFSLFKLDTVSVNSRNKDELHRRWLVHLCKLVWSSIFSWYKNSFFMALTYFKRFFILMTMNAAYFSINQLMIGLVLQHPRSYALLLSKLHFFSTIWTVK